MNPDIIRIIVALIIAVLLLAQFQRSTAGSRRRLAFGLGAAAMVVIATSNMVTAALLPLMVVGGGLALAAVWLLWQAYQRGELEDRFDRARRYLESERRRYDEHDRGGSRDD
ncbi:hypothetical protein A6A03_11095 [Chloroflexus islandicus]|uniref:Uncharacterized protein n=1 Tax=Chloroflexus islandicus TaxID=1707952 RepID=A0A178ME03_9CHLR|nr:hypothetical protein [Chloroflexus islandicus]OAN46999.1 hypothetical protein A6A03_11095 [Chloroflexus islandicus]